MRVRGTRIPPEEQSERPVVRVHPDTLAAMGLAPGPGRLVTALGRLSVTLAAAGAVHPECAVYRRGPWGKFGGGVNRIVSAVETDLGGGSAFYEQRCRLERDQ